MVVIGTDSHKRTHTVVAVDGNGRRLAEKTPPATSDGHLGLIRWARRWRERGFALEDCRHLTRRLEADLLRAGERVVRVPPKLMAGARRSTREPGKSDPINALGREIGALAEALAPSLLALQGCGHLTAAKLLGETGSVARLPRNNPHPRIPRANRSVPPPGPGGPGSCAPWRHRSRSTLVWRNSSLGLDGIRQVRPSRRVCFQSDDRALSGPIAMLLP